MQDRPQTKSETLAIIDQKHKKIEILKDLAFDEFIENGYTEAHDSLEHEANRLKLDIKSLEFHIEWLENRGA